MSTFASARERVGEVDLAGRTLLVPSMHPVGSELLAACFRAIGFSAVVMETGTGLELGREHTSGKECYPCQITLGDVLRHLGAERARLGASFAAGRYAYFMPEATGPCRFGMYNKLHRLVLDRFEEYREIPIASITTADSYGAGGLVPKRDATAFRLMAYMAMIAADVLDRILWRARPYERAPGGTEAVHAGAVARLVETIERGGLRRDFAPLRAIVGAAARAAREGIDAALPRRPRVGMVGEIYLRSHPMSNQGLVRELESHGAEVVNASIAEWLSFITYCRVRERRREAGAALRRRRFGAAGAAFRGWAGQALEYRFLNARRRWLYAAAERHLDIAADHPVHAAERRLEGERHFSFDVGTESVLSIGGALEHAAHGFDGIVNVYPFTCMPGTIATAVLAPLLGEKGVPYLEVPCDGTHRPNRETQVRTFVWQARQRRERARRAG
ncbi:MAG TPA: hypothetical protein VN317_06390 [Candidatus Methanoperedens sp.]|nr:hypothetical protein [Candidatus Methanoperedens sp.]